MFRLTGWRLALIPSLPLFVQRSRISQSSTESLVAPPPTRRIGTVRSFMHRRGYGFLCELENSATKKRGNNDAVTAAGAEASGSTSGAGTNFFFPRSSLDGGFYLTEGQMVTFDVRLVEPSAQLKARLAEAGSVASSSSSLPFKADSDDMTKSERSKSLSVAHRIRLYDISSGKEKPVTPIMLFGYVESWDSLAGTGVIAELDLSGSLHDDAPRFTVSLEDLDLSGRSALRRGRYVRFCLESGDRTAARRVIIDRGAEKKHAVKLSDGSRIDLDTGEQRFYGTVREIVENRFGFILLNDSGESIFFHMSNVEGGAIKPGDIVSFTLRDVALGKHVGKKKCMHVQKCTTRSFTTSSLKEGTVDKSSGNNSKTKRGIEDEDEFELLD